jgi:hypothetical protein
MTISVTVNVIVEIAGEDTATGPPNQYWGVLASSPAKVWQYAIQGPTGGTTQPVDNYLQVSAQNPATLLWIDPSPLMGAQPSGATFVLKGVSSDVGVAISSAYPSLIPVATSNGGTWVQNAQGFTVFSPTPQTFIDMQSSQTLPVKLGWL